LLFLLFLLRFFPFGVELVQFSPSRGSSLLYGAVGLLLRPFNVVNDLSRACPGNGVRRDVGRDFMLENELAGIGVWNIMRSFPQLWLVINSLYDIEKVI
jgi:hypothetical protein